MNSGYLTISLEGNNFSSGTSKTIEGIYERIEGNYGKPILLGDFSFNGVERPSRYVTLGTNGTDFVGVVSITENYNMLFITITSDDLVTITAQ